MKFKIILNKGVHGEYQASVPDLPGCISSGIDEAEALERIQNEILLHLGVEDVAQYKNWRDVAYYQYRLREALHVNMAQKKASETLSPVHGSLLKI